MTENRFVGLPLDEALAICASQGMQVNIVETRSPRQRTDEHRSARVVAVRSCENGLQLVTAFFSDDGPKEPENVSD